MKTNSPSSKDRPDDLFPNKKLGRSVLKHRKQLGMGLREFAALAGVDYTMVLRLERGADIRLSSFIKLAKTHGFPFNFT